MRIALLAAALAPSLMMADMVEMKDGRVVKGHVTAASDKSVDVVVTRGTTSMTSSFPRAEVKSLVITDANSTLKGDRPPTTQELTESRADRDMADAGDAKTAQTPEDADRLEKRAQVTRAIATRKQADVNRVKQESRQLLLQIDTKLEEIRASGRQLEDELAQVDESFNRDMTVFSMPNIQQVQGRATVTGSSGTSQVDYRGTVTSGPDMGAVQQTVSGHEGRARALRQKIAELNAQQQNLLLQRRQVLRDQTDAMRSIRQAADQATSDSLRQ